MDSRVLSISGITPYTATNGKFVEVPLIRLQGLWLEKLGFEVGKKVTVEESQGRLVLEVMKMK